MAPAHAHAPRWIGWLAIPALFFAAIAPQLNRLEFSGGLENLVIATALELRRDHAMTLRLQDDAGRPGWLVPTLEGEPRVKKPPLAAWITALAIHPQTVQQLSSDDPSRRETAWRRLAWEARWPALLAACIMLGAIYELGRLLANHRTGIVSAVAGGTTLLFLRFARNQTIDVHLALWVSLSSLFLAIACFKGSRWRGCLAAGAALGIAFLFKGPLGLLQSVLPLVVYLLASAWHSRRLREVAGNAPGPHASHAPPESGSLASESSSVALRTWLGPAAAGIALMLLIALPWFLTVYWSVPGGSSTWQQEALSERGERPDAFYAYLGFLPYMLPWMVLMIGGMIAARGRMLLALCLALVPLLVMSFYKDRKERYMLPMLGPAAILAAHGLLEIARKRAWNRLDQAAITQHWLILVIIGVVTPALAATAFFERMAPTLDGQPWLSRPLGAGLTVALGMLIALLMLLRVRWLEAMVAATVVVLLAIQAALLPGYARTHAGAAPMKPLAQVVWERCPDALMYNAHPRGKRASVDLSIYLNRVTRWVSSEELASMRPGAQPRVVVMLQDKGQPPPQPPPGWTFLHKIARDKDWWWAFMQERAR